MKTIRWLVLLSITLVSCRSINKSVTNPIKDEIVGIGVKKKLYSKVLDQEREIWIYKPDAYYDMNEADTRYPVVYVMDGESQFISTAAIIEQLSSPGTANDVIPQMMVVGIVNINRNVDLTPPLEEDTNFGSVEFSGGADKMAAFMREELIPYIDDHYTTSDHRVLIGHSLGGLYVLNTLIHHQDLFTNYLSIDPFTAWDKERFSQVVQDSFLIGNYDEKSAYIAMANNTLSFNDRISALKDTSEVMAMSNAGVRFSNQIIKENYAVDIKLKYYEDENHFQVPLPAMYDAFNYFYDFYTFPEMSDYYHPSKSRERVVPALKAHFDQVTKKMGYDVKPMESYVNAWAWGFVQLGSHDNAKDLLELNISYYPNSAHVYTSMAHYMLNQNDTISAKVYLEKSLEKKEDVEVRSELENL